MRPFSERHIGPDIEEQRKMLANLGVTSIEQLVDETIPQSIRFSSTLRLPHPVSEEEALSELESYAHQNIECRNFIGLGYYETILPPVIRRNILENPGWYTQYTPYQAEISQGRLEALLNFQTTVTDLTGLDIANASMLDEATAVAEAIMLTARVNPDRNSVLVSRNLHPQTLAVIETRCQALGLEIDYFDNPSEATSESKYVAIVVPYPDSDGRISDPSKLISDSKQSGMLSIVVTDLLMLTLLRSPGEMGADIAVGSSQRFGVPLGFGGPHAAFFAIKGDLKRQLPGRLVGVSKDASGKIGYRLALQTREQHIRRDKATSNICTAQVLLAVIASMYAVYHGRSGLTKIAKRIHSLTNQLGEALTAKGCQLLHSNYFDTIRVKPVRSITDIKRDALNANYLFRYFDDATIGISIGENTSEKECLRIVELISAASEPENAANFSTELDTELKSTFPVGSLRTSGFLDHPVFSNYRSETEFLRYVRYLESKDLSLTHSMIPLGSCTMKLNATAEMVPISWPRFANQHPFAPRELVKGYHVLLAELEEWLCEIAGFDRCSLQPNAGSQGEYAGLLAIRRYFIERGETARSICLIPISAHGTNPASAVMAGFTVVPVRCDDAGNIELLDLRKRLDEHKDRVAALMVTYPSTHGVFEPDITEICKLVHQVGAQVYMDGANLNAQVGLCRPGDFGADVCHINLHKTFCIPHGGGGPGMGPICVKDHLAPYIPGFPIVNGESLTDVGTNGAVSAAPFGSASILVISWMYIRMMGASGLRQASEIAILNANYIAERLQAKYPILYRGSTGRVAHECILDLRWAKPFGVEVEDIAKRLMDYGFHAPTVSFPVTGTLMVEPTESESLAELDRFCEAMELIYTEICQVRYGLPVNGSPLKNAPHTAELIASNEWPFVYSREHAVFPAPWSKERKFWPAVRRIDGVYGDRNLFCTCPPLEDV